MDSLFSFDFNFDGFAQIAVLFAMGTLMAYLFHRLALPTVLAFIVTGIVLGPSGLSWIHHDQIEMLSHIGIIFLLFLVGLELSVTKIRQLKFQAPLAGVLQLLFANVLLCLVLKYVVGLPWQLSFLFAGLLSLSSTAVVLRTLEESRDLDSIHGRVILGILIVQDLAIIPMMTLLPTIVQPFSGNVAMELLSAVGKAFLFAVVAVWLSLQLLPKILDRLAASNRKDIFLLTVVSLVLCVSGLADWLGLSQEAGALIAGISLSSSMFAHQVFADSRAYRDVFVMLFFVSMGLWVDVAFVTSHWLPLLGCVLGLFTLKGLATYAAIQLSGFHPKNALWGGLALFQVGEFSFVLLSSVVLLVAKNPLWQPIMLEWEPLLRNTIVLTMFVTPLMMRGIPQVLQWLFHREGTAPDDPKNMDVCATSAPRVLVAGFGPIAQNLVTALIEQDVPYLVIEMNNQTIRRLEALNQPCLFGDVSQAAILKKAGIDCAEVLVITFPDLMVAELAIRQAKTLNPEVKVIVRCRFGTDITHFYALGADRVVYEEFETSLKMTCDLMRLLDTPECDVEVVETRFRQRESESPVLDAMSPSPG